MGLFYRLGVILTLLLAPQIAPQIAMAQFVPETQTREIHLLKAEEGDTRVIMRFPLILAYANYLANLAPGSEMSAPFIINSVTDGQQIFRLDSEALLEDYHALSDFLLRGYRFSANGKTIIPEWPEYVVIDGRDLSDPGVNIGLGLTSSASMLTLCVSDYPYQPDISEALIVISFFLADVMPDDPVKIELLTQEFPVPDGAQFVTKITDYRSGEIERYEIKGTSFEPVILGDGAGPARIFSAGYAIILLLLFAGLGFVIYWRKKP